MKYSHWRLFFTTILVTALVIWVSSFLLNHDLYMVVWSIVGVVALAATLFFAVKLLLLNPPRPPRN